MTIEYPQVPEGRRAFIRKKRKSIKKARKVLGELRSGCALFNLFDGTDAYLKAVYKMQAELEEMDRITKPLV